MSQDQLGGVIIKLVNWSYGAAGFLQAIVDDRALPEHIRSHAVRLLEEHDKLAEERRNTLGIR